ncbi:2-oxoglutarate and Fe(II)-dependent oxygenase superfamily protein [Klebsormidium nitens]|uniref:2-oxoglutarate and Fe(II)-dependent oxygenase superfamily protein n=1 Tax=Klebsormidium nitens TaxID=105231 RepID=A0A1Y1HHC2_KLENI|nr:2-oxoglutarate and Fe(II)-dependent oxygenase superfamily protein [Klebsormidium nitens]|eukprot:GAQ77845.1 2-oxoglutarate and Fe(II)-dependent oxygenase superfamily protein [Klebsormidium nitens]
MYAASVRQDGPSGSEAGVRAGPATSLSTRGRAGASSSAPVCTQDAAKSAAGVNAQGNGNYGTSLEGQDWIARKANGFNGTAAAAENHSRVSGAVSGFMAVSGERAQKRGARSVDLDSVELDDERPASAPSFSEPGGPPSEAAVGREDNAAEAVGQKERRKQRLERKRRKESDGDSIPGSKAAFAAQHGGEGQALAERDAGPEREQQNGNRLPHSLSGDIDLGPALEKGETWLRRPEAEGDEPRVNGHAPGGAASAGNAYEACLDEITARPRPLSADFPALGEGVRVPAAAAPLKRFTNLRRPESWGGGDDVTGAKSSWAKHISSRAAEGEGSAAQPDVQTDAQTEEYVRKRTAFEEEDRRKRRKMRTKDDFECFERLKGGRMVNSVQGLVLHEQFLDDEEQAAAVSMIRELEQLGADGGLRGRTYTAPRKWMKGKGRVTIQFGCCYNYAVDKMGRPPGILQDEAVEPMPTFLEDILDRMVRWKVMPGGKKRPNSAIINLYSEGDCIPIHIDHHDFDRPFCTMSLLSVAPIKFGAVMESLDAGQFSGAFELPLSKGSVCILNGNAADVAKHCIPSVPEPRISVTFRRMKPEKAPYMNIVLPLPDFPVFHRRAFSPSLIPPSLGPPSLLSDPLPFEAPRAPPIDVSAEVWPDLLGRSAGGPVEKDFGRASGAQPWAPRPPTRPLSGGGPVRAENGRGSGSGNAPPPLTRASSGGNPVSSGTAEWPDLGTSVKGGPSKRSISAERNGRPNETVRSKPLPSSQSGSGGALPPRPSSQSEAGSQPRERDPSQLPESVAQFESEEPRARENGGGFGRSEMRSASPIRTAGDVRNLSQPSSPNPNPSEASVASESGPSSAVQTKGNQVESMETDNPAPDFAALPDVGAVRKGASDDDPDASRNRTSSQTPSDHASSEPNADSNPSHADSDPIHGPKADEQSSQFQRPELDLTGVKRTESPRSNGHADVRIGAMSPDGFSRGSVGGGQVSRGDRAGQTSEVQDPRARKERSVPLDYVARNGSVGNGHERRTSREPNPDTADPDRNQGLEWRKDRSRTQSTEIAYPRRYEQSVTSAYGGRRQNEERSAASEMARGQSEERSGISYGGRGRKGWRPEFRGRSVERRFSPEPRQGQNGWSAGNGTGSAWNASPGQSDWKRRPDPPLSPGRLVSAADEYRRGAYEHAGAYNPSTGAYGGNAGETYGGESCQSTGMESKGNLAAAAPAFVSRALMRPNSGLGGRSDRPTPSGSYNGASPHQPRRDAGQNGSSSGAHSHRPGWDAASGNGGYSHQPGVPARQDGAGNGAYTHQPGPNAGPDGLGNGATPEAWKFEGENGSASLGQTAPDDDGGMKSKNIPRVDVAWFFDSASTPKSASPGKEQIGEQSAEGSAGVGSPQQSLAMFFPKETPKKEPQSD